MKKYSTFYLPLTIIIISLWWLIKSSSAWGGWIIPMIPFAAGVALFIVRLIKILKQKEISQGGRITSIIFSTVALCVLATIFLFYLLSAGVIH